MRLVIRISMLRLKHFAVLLGRVFTVDEVTFLRPFLHARDETDQICLVGMTGSSLRYGFRRVSRFATLITPMEKSSPSRSSSFSLPPRNCPHSIRRFIYSSVQAGDTNPLRPASGPVDEFCRFTSNLCFGARVASLTIITDGCSETRRLTGFQYRQRAERYRC